MRVPYPNEQVVKIEDHALTRASAPPTLIHADTCRRRAARRVPQRSHRIGTAFDDAGAAHAPQSMRTDRQHWGTVHRVALSRPGSAWLGRASREHEPRTPPRLAREGGWPGLADGGVPRKKRAQLGLRSSVGGLSVTVARRCASLTFRRNAGAASEKLVGGRSTALARIPSRAVRVRYSV